MLPAHPASGRINRTQRAVLLRAVCKVLRATARNAVAQRNRRRFGRYPRHAGFSRGHEKEPSNGIERRRHEISAATLIRQALLPSADIFEDDWPAVWADLPRPLRSRKWLAKEQLATLAIENVEEAVAIGRSRCDWRASQPCAVALRS